MLTDDALLWLAGAMVDASERESRDFIQLEAMAPALLLSPQEAASLEGLPADKKRAALDRLVAIAGWKHRGDAKRYFETVEDAAAYAGVSRRVFYQIVSDLAKTSGLEALGLRLGRLNAAGGRPSREAAAREAARILAEEPKMRMQDVLRALSAGAGEGLSTPILVSIVDEQRRLAPARGGFGEDIRLDSSASDLVDPSGVRQRLYALVDSGTLLLLGWSIMPEGRFMDGYLEAARMASRRERDGIERLADLAGASRMAASVSIPWGEVGSLPLEEAFLDRGWDVVRDPRRIGRTILSTLGRTLAGVRLGTGYVPPGSSRHAKVPAAPTVLTDELVEKVTKQMSEHNRLRYAMAVKGDGSDAVGLLRGVVDAIEVAAL